VQITHKSHEKNSPLILTVLERNIFDKMKVFYLKNNKASSLNWYPTEIYDIVCTLGGSRIKF
jgi:hypothetical protein